MSSWITEADYKPYLTDRRRGQILEQDNNLLNTVELAAIQRVRDALYPKYDVDAIFTTSGAARPAQVLRWVLVIAIAYIYERVPDLQKPTSVKEAYEEVIDELAEIEDGKKSVELPLAIDGGGKVKTKFRWGSQPPRGHSTNL
jgi:hypothetical protein